LAIFGIGAAAGAIVGRALLRHGGIKGLLKAAAIKLDPTTARAWEVQKKFE
jgi:hypothetical protein